MIVLPVDPLDPSPDALARAVAVLRAGEIVALPTDTLYGLAVDPRVEAAVARLFEAKGRGAERAVPLVGADMAQIEAMFGPLAPVARRLAERFWPGPLTIILEAGEAQVAEQVCGKTGTVGVRVPAHAVPRALARAAGHLLTATSANRSGDRPATTAEAVVASLRERVALVLDGGPTPGGAPSTIVDVGGDRPRLVRDGAVPWDRVLQFLQ